MVLRNALFTITFLTFFDAVAHARNYDMYRADYQKGAFCAAIAGACASDNNPQHSFFGNPAALESSAPGLYFDGDYAESTQTLEPGMKTSSDIYDSSYMAGIAYAGNRLGAGLTFRGRAISVGSQATFFDNNNNPHFVVTDDTARSLVVNAPLALRISKTLSIGVSASVLFYDENLKVAGSSTSKTTPIYRLPDVGGSFGFLWKPGKHFRLGSWIISSTEDHVRQDINVSPDGVNVQAQEDLTLYVPARWDTGISIMPWGDRRTFFLDINIVDDTQGGFQRTLDVFDTVANDRSLRSKGRKRVIEPHLAWRSPWPWSMKSHGQYSVGTYYENSRWTGIPGRIHGVAGLSYQLGPIDFVVAIDAASHYLSLLFSIQ